MRARPAVVWLAAAGLAAAAPTRARDLWIGEGGRLSLRTSLKGAAELSHNPDAPLLFPEDDAAASYWRLRFDVEASAGSLATVALAYEHRLRVSGAFGAASAVAGVGVVAVAAEAPPPYRLAPLDAAIAEGAGFAWRHELDRASVALHLGGLELTAGRQAIGWGRGALFGAIDLFAPFAPLDPDREWRRGVDAVRAEVRLSPRLSADAVAALGESVDASAFAARVRGYTGEADAEVAAGWRAGDLFAGGTTSAAVGQAEVHGELALFLAEDPLPSGGAWGNARLAPKAVLGGSVRVPVGRGLVALAEYHYSGFGAQDAEDIVGLLADPAFRERLLRGDTQILGRHAVALLGTLELTNELTAQALALVSPRDGSGVAAPAATYTLSDAASVYAALYVPWGPGPAGLALGSDYGATPLSFFVQVRLYD